MKGKHSNTFSYNESAKQSSVQISHLITNQAVNLQNTPRLKPIKSDRQYSQKEGDEILKADQKRMSLPYQKQIKESNCKSFCERDNLHHEINQHYQESSFAIQQDFHLDILNKIFLYLDYQKKGYIESSTIKWRKVPQQLCEILDVVFRRKKIVNLFDFCFAVLDSNNLIKILRCYNAMNEQ